MTANPEVMTETCSVCGKAMPPSRDGKCTRCRYGRKLDLAPEAATGGDKRDDDDEEI